VGFGSAVSGPGAAGRGEGGGAGGAQSLQRPQTSGKIFLHPYTTVEIRPPRKSEPKVWAARSLNTALSFRSNKST